MVCLVAAKKNIILRIPLQYIILWMKCIMRVTILYLYNAIISLMNVTNAFKYFIRFFLFMFYLYISPYRHFKRFEVINHIILSIVTNKNVGKSFTNWIWCKWVYFQKISHKFRLLRSYIRLHIANHVCNKLLWTFVSKKNLYEKKKNFELLFPLDSIKWTIMLQLQISLCSNN